MKRQDYLNKIEEEMNDTQVEELVVEILDDVERKVNDILDKFSIKDIDDLARISEAVDSLRELSSDLY